MTMIKKAYLLIFIVFGLALLSSCSAKKRGGDSADKPIVVVTIPPLQYFANCIGGDRVQVECLTTEASDPETFEPSIQQLRKASEAEIVLTVGLLPFEEKITSSVHSSNPDAAIIMLSDSIDLIRDTHGEGEMDPHIWLSLRNARIMARQTCAAFSKAMPEDSAYFKERLAGFEADIAKLDSCLTMMLASARGKAFVVDHPSFSYFARDYGLRQIPLGHENKEASLVGLKTRLETIKAESPIAFFYSSSVDERQRESILDILDLPSKAVKPMSSGITYTLSAIGKSLVTYSAQKQ